jgi:ribosome-binding protein aMBF1 (putative translation factor)
VLALDPTLRYHTVHIVLGHVNGEAEKYASSFGRAVRKRRQKLGLSQEEFADVCGLDRTYIGGIERGERNVSLVNLERIAKGLRVSLAELLRSV